MTTNILQRTFRIRYGGSTGTCFTVDVDDRQYIVTARHIVSSIAGQDVVEMQHENTWKSLAVELVGHARGDIDVTVLAPPIQLSPTYPLLTGTAGIVLSQDVYFLRFPYDLADDGGTLNRNFPIPLVKKGILSAFQVDGMKTLLLDGHNNPGFSGGPVVCQIVNDRSNELTAIGIVSGYRNEPKPIYAGQDKTPFTYYDNTGIVVATAIDHALDLIRENPLGFDLTSGAN